MESRYYQGSNAAVTEETSARSEFSRVTELWICLIGTQGKSAWFLYNRQRDREKGDAVRSIQRIGGCSYRDRT